MQVYADVCTRCTVDGVVGRVTELLMWHIMQVTVCGV
jgi:hypothetical protein